MCVTLCCVWVSDAEQLLPISYVCECVEFYGVISIIFDVILTNCEMVLLHSLSGVLNQNQLCFFFIEVVKNIVLNYYST